MNAFRRSALAAALVAAAGSLVPLAASAQTTVKIDGSSTVYPVTEAVAEEFQKAEKNAIKVTVGISGTGGGFKKFCRGESDISNASRPILKSEMDDCAKLGIKYFELPVAFDALTVVANPKNQFLKSMTVEQLKALWEPAAQGKITRWNQVNPAWPDAPIKLFGAGSDSGTFDYFTEAIVGKAKSSRGDYAATEDDHVTVQGVASDVNALGYLGFAYYAENDKKLKPVGIADKGGKPVVIPSEKAVLDGTYQPLSRPIFIYVNTKSYERPEIKKFVDYYLSNGEKLAKEVKYVPLPSRTYVQNKERVAKGNTGTAFGGVAEVGVKIDDLMGRPLK